MIKNSPAILKSLFFTYIIALICLMILTIKPDQMEIPKQLFGIQIDKIVHFILFFPYPILAWLTFNSSLREKIKSWTLFAIFISGLLLATITEFAQLFNSTRSFDPKDMIANYSAILAGIITIIFISLFKKIASQHRV